MIDRLKKSLILLLLSAFILPLLYPDKAQAADSEIDRLINQAAHSVERLRDFYPSESDDEGALVFTPKFEQAYNQAKWDLLYLEYAADSLSPIGKSIIMNYQNGLEDKLLRTTYLIDSIKMGQLIEDRSQKLNEYIKNSVINDEMVKAYHELSRDIRKAEVVFSRVYGSKNRTIVREHFLIQPKITREQVIYEVSQYILLEKIKQLFSEGKLSEAKASYDMLERLERRAIEIKIAGNQLYPGRYPIYPRIDMELEAIKSVIQKYVYYTSE